MEVDVLQRMELLRDQLPLQLRVDDRTSAGLGLEMRVPFLDYRLVEFACRLPLRFKIRAGWTKWLLRKYMDRHGLSEIAWRKQKLGFNAPTNAWTQSVVKKRWEALMEAPAQSLIKRRSPPHEMPFMVYNLFELSLQMNWADIELN